MIRLLLASPFALVLTVAIFSLMSWMTGNNSRNQYKKSEPVSFNIVMAEHEQELQRRKRSLPEQPKTPEMPQPVSVKSTLTSASKISSSLPSALGLDTNISGVEISAPQFRGFENSTGNKVATNQAAMPLYRVEPRYPAKAERRKIEGYVMLSFTIDPTGKTTDIKVLESKPHRVFDREAIRAVRKWKYRPEILNGVAISQPGQHVKLEFKLAK